MSRLLLATLLLAAGSAPPPKAQERPDAAEGPRIEADMVLKARVEDPLLVRRLLAQQLLDGGGGQVEALELLDLAGDGFGEGDALRLLPGGKTSVLRPLDRELRETLAAWSFAANQEIHAASGVDPAELRNLAQPVAALLADVLAAERRHLGRSDVELALDSSPAGLVLRVWDFSGDSLFARPGQEGGRRVADVVQILREDTTYVVDRVLRDVLILESQSVDTVFVGKPARP